MLRLQRPQRAQQMGEVQISTCDSTSRFIALASNDFCSASPYPLPNAATRVAYVGINVQRYDQWLIQNAVIFHTVSDEAW
jgi:hypothetical protein